MLESFLKDLNKNQNDAVVGTEGPSLIIAGAGSGKTRVLTYRVAYLLSKGVNARKILALTFTNKAADEMKNRIAELVGRETSRNLWMGTFHSIFSKILRIESLKLGFNSNYTIYDTEDSKSVIKSIINELKLDKDVYKPGEIAGRISKAKNNLILAKDYAENSSFLEKDRFNRKPEFYKIYLKYSKMCYKNNAMDFDDLLIYTNILLRDNEDVLNKYQNLFDYILVDEYQDTNYSQYLILNKLSAMKKNLCVVGDDAQSIYSFRGAKIENILNFKNDFPEYKLFKLEQNYRSTKNILNAANSVIGKNEKQIPKKIWSDKAEGKKIKIIDAITDGEEGYLIAGSIIEYRNNEHSEFSDFAVLYRTNAQSRIFEEAFRKKNIPYKIYGGLSFYQRKEIKDILAYLRLAINSNDNEALKRIINYPARGIGKTTTDKIEEIASENDLNMWDIVSDPHKFSSLSKGGAASKLSGFATYISDLSKKALINNAYDFVYYVAKSSGMLKELMNEKTPENLSRYENIQELLNSIKDYTENLLEEEGTVVATIDKYLENVALITSQDTDKQEDLNKVSLMTIHSAKGLEFRNVYIVGVEEELFPSPMNSNSVSELEEERRLFYVAITRAKEYLVISHAKSRYKWGSLTHSRPSRFIKEIDREFIEDGGDVMMNGFSSYSLVSENKNSIKESGTKSFSLPDNEDFIPAKQEKIQSGMSVFHQKFGKGKVIQLEGTYPDTKATVFFVNFGQKKLLLKFAQLKILK